MRTYEITSKTPSWNTYRKITRHLYTPLIRMILTNSVHWQPIFYHLSHLVSLTILTFCFALFVVDWCFRILMVVVCGVNRDTCLLFFIYVNSALNVVCICGIFVSLEVIWFWLHVGIFRQLECTSFLRLGSSKLWYEVSFLVFFRLYVCYS